MGAARGVGRGEHVGDDDEGDAAQRLGDGVGLGHGDDGVCGEDPEHVYLAAAAGAEEVDGLEARPVGNPWRVPELLHQEAVGGVLEVEMRREHVGKSADLAAAHGVGLAGEAPCRGGRCGRSPGGS